ncbi:sensor histidine kinase [Actinoplanes aureus]|uniref:histidine kinase n=1 Tax=Actinoplanes aureus TaxID=2792083 RepID=A0A931G3Z2_9ACTN|nr:sensor histidine kinase [Actinoplanes aureus]MBG0567451.1 sensor histidine kinase [Actinoplanes aureus]
MLRQQLRRIRRTDVAVAAGFTAFAVVEEQLIRMPGNWWPYALAGYTLLILIRRLIPLLAMIPHGFVVLSVFYVETTIDGEKTVNFRLWQVVAMVVCAYTVGRWEPPFGPDRRITHRGAAGALLILGTVAMYNHENPGDPMANIFFPLAPYVLGIVVSVQARRLADAAGVRAEFRERQAREAVTEERVRIARELHDMVAHSVTVMVIQAGVVRRRLDAGLPVDPQLLQYIESAGRDAVTELRRTLGLLRGDGDGTAQPPVGLDRLDDLVGQVREAGLAVTVRRGGEPVPLLPAVDVSAYRIVQEALTNVLKHAHAASAELTVDYRADGLHLGVVNDGPPAAPSSGGGQGLIGMRERVTLFGGDLHAGPRPPGGFAVEARLPVLPAAVRDGAAR